MDYSFIKGEKVTGAEQELGAIARIPDPFDLDRAKQCFAVFESKIKDWGRLVDKSEIKNEREAQQFTDAIGKAKGLVKDFEKQEIPKSAAGLEEFQIGDEEEDYIKKQKNANAKLVYADNLIKLGDYQLGIRIYLEVYNDVKYREDQRDDAIFKLGKTYESVLYEEADISKSIYYYELLITEFPLSDRRLEAFQRSQLLRLQLEEREIYKRNNTTE